MVNLTGTIPLCITIDICALIFLIVTIVCISLNRRDITIKNIVLEIILFIFVACILIELFSYRIGNMKQPNTIRFIHSCCYFVISITLFVLYTALFQRALLDRTDFLKSQNTNLKAFAKIYNSMHIIDLKTNTAMELQTSEEIDKYIDKELNAVNMMSCVISQVIVPDMIKEALEFTDLTTIAERLKEKDTIVGEFKGRSSGWVRARFTVLNRDKNSLPSEIVFATVIIQQEKKKEEGLIQITRTDDFTQINNRRALVEALDEFDKKPDSNIFIVSIDINGLKNVNDTLGHAAGDELILGTVACMKDSLKGFGNLYRIGGDEFIALLSSSDKVTIATALKSFQQNVDKWKGEKVSKLSVSFGFVSKQENPDKKMEELVILADRKMYEMKKQHYMERDFDRRNR